MTYSQILTSYLGSGTHAARPVTPNVAAGVAPIYYETDTLHWFGWTGSAWVQIDGGGAGSLELTDGSTDLTSVTKITAAMLAVGGTAGASTLTPNLTNSSGALSGDVTTASADTFIDGPSVTVGAGSWLITAKVCVLYTSAAAFVTGKLWDGTTAYDAGQLATGGAAYPAMLPFTAVVSPGTTKTYKVSCATSATGGTLKILAAPPNDSPGNFASRIVAVRIA